MAVSVLDVIIDPRKAAEGARQVVKALDSMGGKAQQAMKKVESTTEGVKNALFSMRSAIALLGIGVFAKGLLDVSRNLDQAERGLRTVTASAGQASIQLERIRKIADEFMFDDLPMANSFRLMASNGIPDTERALRVLGNTALALGEDVESVTTAILTGNERALRRLGVQLVDLGQGQVDLIFGDMETRVEKTDTAIRRGLLDLLEKGIPDATKKTSSSMSFQIDRIKDAWEDMQVAIMRGGLEDFMTQTFGAIADGFSPEEITKKGEKVADAIKKITLSIARDTAAVLDFLTPLGNLVFGVLSKALTAFDKLPPEAQVLGIVGFFYFGTVGKVAMIAGLTVADALNLKLEKAGELIKGIEKAAIESVRQSPLGQVMEKAAELFSGKKAPKEIKGLVTQTMEEREKVSPTGPSLGALDQANADGTKSFSAALEELIVLIDKRTKKEQALREEEKRRAEQSGGAQQKKQIDEGRRRLEAQLGALGEETDIFVRQERMKQNALFDPEMAAALGKAIDFTNTQRERGNIPLADSKKITEELLTLWEEGKTPTGQVAKSIADIFMKIGLATQATRDFNDEEAIKAERLKVTNDLLADSKKELDDMVDANVVLNAAPQDREKIAAQLKLERTLLSQKVIIAEQDKQTLRDRIALMDEEAKKLMTRNLMEERRLQLVEETAQLQDETKDILAGTQGRAMGSLPGAVGSATPSAETLLNQRRREVESKGGKFGPDEQEIARMEIANKLKAQSQNFIARENFEMKQQQAINEQVAGTMGMMLDAREAEIRTRQTIIALQQKGVDVTQDEANAIRETSKALQASQEQLRTANAMNNFVDGFRVGWDTIVDLGSSAFDRLEDSMLTWIQTGKLDFKDFANFVTTELIRIGIRAALMQAVQGAVGMFSGGGGMLSGMFSSFMKSGGPGLGTGSGDLVPAHSDMAQRGGMFDEHGRIPGFQRGGVNHNERTIRISEGQTPEAIIPLRGGKVPVKMMGGSGNMTVNAPITIITPDAAGARRSSGQIQAELSMVLSRAVKRNT